MVGAGLTCAHRPGWGRGLGVAFHGGGDGNLVLSGGQAVIGNVKAIPDGRRERQYTVIAQIDPLLRALPVRAVSGLDQGQEPGQPGDGALSSAEKVAAFGTYAGGDVAAGSNGECHDREIGRQSRSCYRR
jgi:hypothetical protein